MKKKDPKNMNSSEFSAWVDEIRQDPEFPKIMKEFRKFWDNGGVR